MKANKGKIILRYRKEDIENRLKIGRFHVANIAHSPQFVCEQAVIEDSADPEYRKGDEAIVSYLIGLDHNQADPLESPKRNGFFISKEDNGDEIRWCNNNDMSLSFFGVRRSGKIIPRKGYVFAKLPPPPPEKKGNLFIPEPFRKQDTDRKAYYTTILHIHPYDSHEMQIWESDEIWCEPNSDIKKSIFGQEVLVIPATKILAKREWINDYHTTGIRH